MAASKPLFSTYVEPLKDKPDDELQPEPKTQYQDNYNDFDNDDKEQYDDDFDDYDSDEYKPTKKTATGGGYDGYGSYGTKQNKKKQMSPQQFKDIDLESLFFSDDDNFDIARKICEFYDEEFGDKDTVFSLSYTISICFYIIYITIYIPSCMVADIGKKPAMSYWVSGEYVRRHDNIQNKRIIVYRACKHIPAKQPIVTHKQFVEFVKKLSIKYEDESTDIICDLMDKEFGDGCHYCRSSIENASYDIYSRFSDDYDAGFRLPSGAYVIAWRR